MNSARSIWDLVQARRYKQKNREGLHCAASARRRPLKLIVLDIDSSESPIYGEQEGSAYNGHPGCICYHPLFVFKQFGDLE